MCITGLKVFFITVFLRFISGWMLHQKLLKLSNNPRNMIYRYCMIKDSSKLPKKYTKSNLPVKTCQQCGRPMEWRKSWEKNWEEVKYCSDKCRRDRKSNKSKTSKDTGEISPKFNSYDNQSKFMRQLMKSDISFFIMTAAFIILSSFWTHPSYASASSRPTAEEIRTVFEDIDWGKEQDAFQLADFRRLDESSDVKFYSTVLLIKRIFTFSYTPNITNSPCSRGLSSTSTQGQFQLW